MENGGHCWQIFYPKKFILGKAMERNLFNILLVFYIIDCSTESRGEEMVILGVVVRGWGKGYDRVEEQGNSKQKVFKMNIS